MLYPDAKDNSYYNILAISEVSIIIFTCNFLQLNTP